ncbi:MAG: hypothetical protein HY512_03630 [Candidatus Aenigmarchaeota archaeon]|nr:hypothetical protein [Candidatus Aenigmarchaeota archaeon]
MATEYFGSEGLRKLSIYLESIVVEIGDFIGNEIRPAYASSSFPVRNYTQDDRTDLDGNVLWAKHGGKLHKSESGRILKINAGNGRGVIDVPVGEKPKDKTLTQWVVETYGVGRDKVSQALKGFR